MTSLREALGGHRNSLGVVRLVMASAVIFDHAFPLGFGVTAPFLAYTRGQQSLGGLAVLGFLAVSGYLITKSAMSSDVLQYLWRRFLRIFPGFWLVLIVGGFIIGPIIWLLDGNALGNYFVLGTPGPFAYLTNNWTLAIGQFQILNIFESNPFGLAGFGGPMNGSIWTLTYEWMCYILIAVLLAVGVLKRAKIVVPIATVVFLILQVLWQLKPELMSTLPVVGDWWRVNFGFIFFIGASLAVYSHKVPFSNLIGISAGVAGILLLVFGGFNTVGYFLFAYCVLWLAARLPRQVQWIGGKNDYSYGVYLYGWPMEQVMAYIGVQKFGYFPFVIASLLAAGACAWLSWHIIEKRALQLKSWGPGRGIPHWWGKIVGLRKSKAAVDAPQEAPAEPITTSTDPLRAPTPGTVVSSEGT